MSLLTFAVHTDDSSEGAGPGTNADVVKAFGCSVVKVIAASGTATRLATGTVILYTQDRAAAGGAAKLAGWTGRDRGKDGGDRSRSPRRSTLLDGAMFADNDDGATVDTGTTGDVGTG